MNQEHQIVRQVQKAQGDSRAADQLIRQYLPFIKSETARFLTPSETGHFDSAP